MNFTISRYFVFEVFTEAVVRLFLVLVRAALSQVFLLRISHLFFLLLLKIIQISCEFRSPSMARIFPGDFQFSFSCSMSYSIQVLLIRHIYLASFIINIHYINFSRFITICMSGSHVSPVLPNPHYHPVLPPLYILVS